jgi:hypothetical protein
MITVRVVQEGGRLRLRCVSDNRFVQCPRAWRDTLPVGVPITLDAKLRADGECYVYAPAAGTKGLH